MNPWLQALGYVGLGGVFVAIINGLFSKRKLSADATKIITDAASGIVERLQQENARVAASNLLLSGKVEALQIEQAAEKEWRRHVDQLLAMHQLWDMQAVEIAQSHGIDLPPPPPLNTGT